MTKHLSPDAVKEILGKATPGFPVIVFGGALDLSIRAGTTFRGHLFAEDTPVPLPAEGLTAGTDYVVVINDGSPSVRVFDTATIPDDALGGFYFAPGGNAAARSGGDETPAINPLSIWDIAFRPACADVRGMTFVRMPHGPDFWCDIYLLGAKHLANGTSRFGAMIADGNDLPENPAGEPDERFDGLDYATAVAVMKHHGKGLLSFFEFIAAAHGVTEKTSRSGDPDTTQLDAPRTSRVGVMQATGNLWIWGHDGDPDNPRASLFGGSWFGDDDAGSRRASVAYRWPDDSREDFGARGRSDHLNLI